MENWEVDYKVLVSKGGFGIYFSPKNKFFMTRALQIYLKNLRRFLLGPWGIFSAPHFSPSITAVVHGPNSTLEALAFPPLEEGVERFPILRLTSKSPTEAKCSGY